jgi:intracellular septation protein
MRYRHLVVSFIADVAPIVTFVVATELVGFMNALWWLVGVAALSIGIEWLVSRRIPKFGLVASGTIVAFGLVSVMTGDEFFIIVKDTLYALAFGGALLVGIVLRRSYLESLFGDYFAISARGWSILTYRWMVFFFLLAATNELARLSLTPDQWVYYKFGAVIATWIFGFYQFTLSRRERLPEANPWGLRVRRVSPPLSNNE